VNGVEQTLIGGVDGGTGSCCPRWARLMAIGRVVNLGTREPMLAGALSAYAVTQSTATSCGLIAGVAGGALVGAAHSWIHDPPRRRSDRQRMVALFLASGSPRCWNHIVGTVITPLPKMRFRGCRRFVGGPDLFDHDILVYSVTCSSPDRVRLLSNKSGAAPCARTG